MGKPFFTDIFIALVFAFAAQSLSKFLRVSPKKELGNNKKEGSYAALFAFFFYSASASAFASSITFCWMAAGASS